MTRASTLAMGLALALCACGPRGKTTPPVGPTKAGATTIDPVTGATAFAYDAATLRSTARVELTSTGGGVYLQATGTLNTDLDVKAEGDGLVIGWDITKIEDLRIDGTLPPSAHDPAKYLAEHGSGAWVVDAKGKESVAATDSHPANAARRKLLDAAAKKLADAKAAGQPVAPDAATTLLERLPPLLALPTLPAQPLKPGQTDEQTSTTELELPQFDVVLSIDSTRRVTLVVVDDSGTTKLAELQIVEDRYGGVETEEGDIELEEKIEGTLLFDLDRGVPFRFEQTTTMSFTAGEQGGDTTRTVRTDFTVAPP